MTADDADAPFLDPAQPVAMKRIERMTGMSRAELDELPIGVIQVDREGTILEYNAAEGRLAGRDRDDVLGKNFFTDVAPCTNVQQFAGRFRTELGSDRPPIAFPYEFTFPKKNVRVMVLLHWQPEKDCGWIFVQAAHAE